MTRTRLLACAVALAAAAVQFGVVQAATASYQLTMPSSAQPFTSTAVTLKLPAGVAAVDGRVLFDKNALDFVGVAPTGSGRALAPVDIPDGAAFGAYNLTSSKSGTTIRLIVAPRVQGSIALRVVIDSMASSVGGRLSPAQTDAVGALRSGTSAATFAAPQSVVHFAPVRSAGPVKTLVGQRILLPQDVESAAVAWQNSRLNGAACGSVDAATDANGDGCIDVVDLQAVQSALGAPAALNPAVKMVAPNAQVASLQAAANTTSDKAAASLTFSKTFTVTYAGDGADSNPGDGTCADSQGRCTLRAAIQESNWSHGPDLINFNMPGNAPISIQLGSTLPILSDKTGGATIDAYTQPGSQVNTAQYGSNAIPGVSIQGTSGSPRGQIFYITSAGNTIRGFALSRAYRPIVLDGTDAHDNSIIGNWVGMTATGGLSSYQADIGIYLQQGTNHNHIGTSDLADRNIIGTATKAIDNYGPGTGNTSFQNNDLCMTPSGGAATCSTGIDHDFGPKANQIGGFGLNEKNVVGPTTLNGFEISHGWDPNHQDTSNKWVNMNIHIEGNWIGFRMDGSYSANYRSGLNNPGSADNGNGVNVYDGCNQNVVDGNYIASAYDGVNTMRSNCSNTTIQNNIIGVSPQGQNAPMSWWGIHVRLSTTDDLILNNTISNATKGGIGLSSIESGGNVSAGERRIRISRNIVSNTNGPAIYLTATNGSDAPGSNALYASPVITAATTTTVSGTGIAGATVEVYQASRNAGQSGLPSVFLGTGTVAGNGSWSIPVTAAQNSRVTALEIAPNGNTSMLSTNVDVTFVAPPPAPVANFDWSQEAGNLTVDFTDTSTNTPTNWTWDFGDGSTSTLQSPSHTYATATDYQVKLTASNGGGSDNRTKTITVSPLSGATIYAADSFGRSTSDGWSNADTGGPYTVQNNATNYSVGAGFGSMTVPNAGGMRSAFLNTVSAQDVDISFDFTVDKAPAGGAYWIYAAARRNGNNEYRIKIHMFANGTVGIQASKVINNAESMIGPEVIVSGLSVTPGTFVNVHAQMVGNGSTAFYINAWTSGQSEPAGWQYTGGDNTAALQSAGSVGLRAYLGGNVSTAPVTFSFDDYSVIAPQ